MSRALPGPTGSSTVIIHRHGEVTYFSQSKRVLRKCRPESVWPEDLAKMSRRDRDRLVARFGTTQTGRGPVRLMSATERAAGTERE